ncbi:hypothetical protein [Neisseria mucosa]|nr:hypothetical protein [Neisseria mucosa]
MAWVLTTNPRQPQRSSETENPVSDDLRNKPITQAATRDCHNIVD